MRNVQIFQLTFKKKHKHKSGYLFIVYILLNLLEAEKKAAGIFVSETLNVLRNVAFYYLDYMLRYLYATVKIIERIDGIGKIGYRQMCLLWK